MPTFENFPNAPIQEGLLDFRVTFSSPPETELFDQLRKSLAERYPKFQDLHRYEAKLEFGGGVSSANHGAQFAGVRFEAEDRGFVFQAQVDGFTMSKLKPYRDWDELVAEAKISWLAYVSALKPIAIERIACRFINRFEVGAERFDFGQYFTAAPAVPPKLPQGVSRYLVQMEIPVPQSGVTALLTQALEGVSDKSATFMIDIDVFRIAPYEVSDQKLWIDLNQLRDLKNQFFFESITEKTKELFR